MEKSPAASSRLRSLVLGFSLLFVLYLASLYNYLLFHVLGEMFAIVIASSIFILVWNSRAVLDNGYILFIGIAYLFVSGLDLLHTLSYKGMGLFPGYDANLPTQLWIAMRYLSSLSLMVAPFFVKRRIDVARLFALYSIAVLLLLGSIFFWGFFPACYVEGVGLTPFKIRSEYVICSILLFSIAVLWRFRTAFDDDVFRLLVLSIVSTIISEMAFTLYVSPYGFSNLIGHYFSIAAFYLMYRAIIETGLVKPYALLFRDLKQSEEACRRAMDELEIRVAERTRDLLSANKALETEMADRRRAEEERLRLVTGIEQVTEGVIMTDQRGTIQYVNPAFCRITGFSRDEIIGKNTTVLKRSKFDDAHYETIAATLDEGRSWTGRVTNRRKDGTFYEAELAISPIRDRAGTIVNYVAVERDITEQVKMERHIRQSQKMEALGTLAGGIAHDFNNILYGIIGFTEMALEDIPETNPVHKQLQFILKAALRGRDLVRQILAFCRKGDHERRPVEMGPAVRETLTLLRASLPSSIEIQEKIAENPGAVLGNPTEIQQVLMNLCTNAVHAMGGEGGSLTVLLSRVNLGAESPLPQPDLDPGPYVKLMVSDTGHGMEKAVVERIFDPFFTTKGPDEGTGMGLSVVHGIVKSMNGSMGVYSEPGKGSTFSVYFPVIDGTSAAEEGALKAPGGNERILVVEDEEVLMEMVQEMLARLGYDVVGKHDPLEALNTFRAAPDGFDLVLTDLNMPVMNGIELAKELVSVKADIPIILSTGFRETISEEDARAAGIRGFVSKPVVRNELALAVRRFLDGKK